MGGFEWLVSCKVENWYEGVDRDLLLVRAVKYNDVEGVAWQLRCGADPNLLRPMGWSLLHEVAKEGRLRVAKLLVEYGAEVDVVEAPTGTTPLYQAALMGHQYMCHFLVRRGADIEKCESGWDGVCDSPVDVAIRLGRVRVLKYFEEAT